MNTGNDFEWQVPEHFNFGATIDHYAQDPNRVALVWEDQEGRRARFSFADLSAQSNRIANVLTGLGIRRGDPILLVLPRISLWQAAYIGALKIGALVIPCTAMLREKDLIYRANHSGARAVIAGLESAAMIGELRSHCPSVTHYLIAGSTRSGWMGLPESMQQASPIYHAIKTRSDEPAICYYTRARPKSPRQFSIATHTPESSIYGSRWLDLRPGDLTDDFRHRWESATGFCSTG